MPTMVFAAYRVRKFKALDKPEQDPKFIREKYFPQGWQVGHDEKINQAQAEAEYAEAVGQNAGYAYVDLISYHCGPETFFTPHLDIRQWAGDPRFRPQPDRKALTPSPITVNPTATSGGSEG